ncbi:hypothetical protein PMAYCL1PPCAC_32368, partial [Pristionchus mayeri]
FQNIATLTITNANRNYASGNIVLYVVNHNAEYFKTAEVYEAVNLDRKPSLASVITVLSARPFTLRESNYMSMGVRAKLAGFDTLDSTTCPDVYSLSWLPFPGFTMTINAPIISLLYDLKQFPYPAAELKAFIGISDTHQMEQNGFLASAGWHGCAGKLLTMFALRNNLKKTKNSTNCKNFRPQDVTINVETNASTPNDVVVTASNGTEIARY